MAVSRFEAEKFSGKNDFGLWRLKMKAMLVQQGLADALKADQKWKVEPTDAKEKAKMDEILERAHSAIILNLGDKVLRDVEKETTAAGIWSKLESLYMTKSLANRLYIKQRLYSFKIVDEKGIEEQLELFNKTIDDLENIDVKLEDEDKAIILLNALPKSFEQLKHAMLYGRETSITLEEVQSALKCKELQKQSSKITDPMAESLNIRNAKGKKGFKKKFGGPKQPQNYKAAQESEKETRSCHYCKKPGHLKKNCYSWKRKQAEEEGTKNTTDCVEEVEVPQVLNVMENREETPWIMDSGCSFHMCPIKNWFTELTESRRSVLLGNNQICRIRGIGSITFKMHDGALRSVTGVRYIPEIKRNLISLGVLEASGYSFMSSQGVMRVIKNRNVVMMAERRSSLYYLIAEVISGSANVAQKIGLKRWHLRMGHLGENGMKELAKRNLIKLEDQHEQLGVCEQCILGKSKKLAYPKGTHTSTAALDYAHSDLWGPATPVTMRGGKYFLSIIDDFSRKLWVFILKEKSETFTKFKD